MQYIIHEITLNYLKCDIYSFNKYFLSTYFIPNAVSGTGNIAVAIIGFVSAFIDVIWSIATNIIRTATSTSTTTTNTMKLVDV